MFSWLTSKEKQEHVLVVDIGSDHVSAGMVRHVEGERPHVLVSTSFPSKISQDKEYEHIMHYISQSLDQCLKRMLHRIETPPVRIITALHAPWTTSQTRTLVKKFSTSEPFTQEKATELIQKEIEKFHNKKIPEFKDYAHDHELLEQKTMGVRLNGYHTENPYGKKAQHIEIDSFMSITPTPVISTFSYALEHTFHIDHEHHSSMFIAYSVIRNMLHKEHEAVIVDLGGEVTEVGIVHKDILIQSISFPYGFHDIYRHLAKEYNISYKEAQSMIHLYQHNLLSRDRMHDMEKTMHTIYGVWISKFHRMMKESLSIEVLPHSVFLYAPKDLMPFFQEFLQDDTITHYTQNTRSYIVTPMDISTLQGKVIDHEQVYDPEILQLALFAQHTLGRKSPEQKYYW